LASAALAVAAGLIAAPSLIGAARAMREGRRALANAADAVRTDHGRARWELERVHSSLASAERKLASPWTAPVRYTPVIGRQIRAVGALARAGRVTAEAALIGLDSFDPGRMQVRRGVIDVGAFGPMSEGAAAALKKANNAAAELEASPGSFLAPPIRGARTQMLEKLRSARAGLHKAIAGLRVAPALLGADGRRRYVVAFANPAEARGTGGYWGLYNMLEADGGRIRVLHEAGRPRDLPSPDRAGVQPPDWFRQTWGTYGATRIWANINMSADFPTVARLAVETLRTRGRHHVDGLIQIDPVGLAALLQWSGPVSIPSWPEPITSENIARIAEHDVYLRYPAAREEEARTKFGRDVIGALFAKINSSDRPLTLDSLSVLAQAASSGHVQVFARDPGEQQGLETVGIAHGVDRAAVGTDVLGLVTNNAAANKTDWFAQREVSYDVSLDPENSIARGRIEVVVRNGAPRTGLPTYVIGPNKRGFGGGENRTLLRLLRAPEDSLTVATMDGAETWASRDRESALRAYALDVWASAGETRRLEVHTTVRGAVRQGVYRLVVLGQPVAHPDRFTFRLHVPRGWRVDGPTTFDGPLTDDVVAEVRVTRTFPGRVAHFFDNVATHLFGA
jgi:hypothetical protein